MVKTTLDHPLVFTSSSWTKPVFLASSHSLINLGLLRWRNFLYGKIKNWINFSTCSLARAIVDSDYHLHWPTHYTLTMWSRMQSVFTSTRAHSWLLSKLLTKIFRSFSSKLFPEQLVPIMYCSEALFLPRHRIIFLSLLKFRQFCVSSYLQSACFSLNVDQSSELMRLPNWYLPWTCWICHLVSPPRSIKQDTKQYKLQYQPIRNLTSNWTIAAIVSMSISLCDSFPTTL